MDFERLAIPVVSEDDDFAAIQKKLDQQSADLLAFLQENYNQVTLSLETNYRGVFESAGKRIEYVDFLQKEYLTYFAKVVTRVHDKQNSRELIRIINQFDYLFQIHDSIEDIYNTKKVMSQHYIELKSDILLIIRELSSQTLALFDEMTSQTESGPQKSIENLSRSIQEHIDDSHRALLSLLSDPLRKDAGALMTFITYSQRLKDKLINYVQTKNHRQQDKGSG